MAGSTTLGQTPWLSSLGSFSPAKFRFHLCIGPFRRISFWNILYKVNLIQSSISEIGAPGRKTRTAPPTSPWSPPPTDEAISEIDWLSMDISSSEKMHRKKNCLFQKTFSSLYALKRTKEESVHRFESFFDNKTADSIHWVAINQGERIHLER